MTSLKENLEALSASLPDLPSELELLKALAERVEGAVVDFLNETFEKHAQADTHLEELHQTLTDLGRGSEAERSQLESRMESFEERLGTILDELRDDQGDLSQAVEAVGSATEGVKDVLHGTSASVRSSEEAAVRELGDVEESAGSAEEGMRAAFDQVAAEADALGEAVQESRESVAQALSGLLQRMRDVASQATHRIEQTAERLDGLRAAHEAEVPEQRARLIEEQQEIVAHLRERIETELRTRIDQSTEAVLGALTLMRDEGARAAEACQSANETLKGAFEALREATRPLPPAIEAVKQAAVQVGLSWG